MEARKLAEEVAQYCADRRGENIEILHVEEAIGGIVDYFVIVSGKSGRQLSAMAETVRVELKKTGRLPLGIEGLDEATWVLLDYGDVVLHLFLPATRAYYNLEFLWSSAPRLAWEPQPRVVNEELAEH